MLTLFLSITQCNNYVMNVVWISYFTSNANIELRLSQITFGANESAEWYNES